MKVKGTNMKDIKEIEKEVGVSNEDKIIRGAVTRKVMEEATEVDLDLGCMTFDEPVEKSSSGDNKKSVAQEVEDFDLGDVSSADELYRMQDEQKKVDSKVLSAVDSNMSEIKNSMNDIILKQAQVLEKNADSMQSMQDNLTTVVKSQSEMVSSISRAIDKKFSQQDGYVSGLVEEKVDEVVYDAVAKPIEKQNKKRRRRKRGSQLWGIIKIAIILLVCVFLYTNDSTRTRIGLVATDVKEIVVDIINGEEVSTNKLVRDLGVKLHKINTVYYDEEGNEISEEEYLEKVKSGEATAVTK